MHITSSFLYLWDMICRSKASPERMNNGTRPDDRKPKSSGSSNGDFRVLTRQSIENLDDNKRVPGTSDVLPSIDFIQEVRGVLGLVPFPSTTWLAPT
jgi:hypothetical protein